ncbi:MAG: hypothetical protein GY760_28300, partial [Deltaproteobacteria bacterium]|nr:hypothetical protein [Deltaproteobacteria bacterium]
RIGSLEIVQGQDADWAQLYLVDIDEALDIRLAHQRSKYFESQRAKDIMRDLSVWLKEHNNFVKQFEMAMDHQAEEDAHDLCLIFNQKKNVPQDSHAGVWNLPSSGGIGGLLQNASQVNGRRRKRDIVIRVRGNNQTTLRGICETNQLYDPLHYVLLFPTGIVSIFIKTIK